MRNLLSRLRHEDDAATAVEYAIIAAIVGVALIGTLIAFRDSISAMLNRAASVIQNQ
ncbi:MAG: Flp family type IVb pilin [Myxococcales bacterium]|jgi:Flp pilus assembly pilin Flp|nr:Flp family type IVb pilin [Myxococcales bacterium]